MAKKAREIYFKIAEDEGIEMITFHPRTVNPEMMLELVLFY